MLVKEQVIGKIKNKRIRSRTEYPSSSRSPKRIGSKNVSSKSATSSLGYFYKDSVLYRIRTVSANLIVANDVSILPYNVTQNQIECFEVGTVNVFNVLSTKDKSFFPKLKYNRNPTIFRVLKEYPTHYQCEYVNYDYPGEVSLTKVDTLIPYVS